MLKALKANQLIEKYSLELLKCSLSGDRNDFWQSYDQMLQALGYARVILDAPLDETFVVKNYENRMYHQYKRYNKKKIQAFDLSQTIEMKNYWQKQRQHSDKLQHPNLIHCILTPLRFSLSSEISKLSDYKLSSYAFYLKDHIVYSNKLASNKGIIKGLPILLAKKIDPDTKFIQINRFSHNKFEEIFAIFKEKYRQLNPFLKGQQIHFTFRYKKSDENITERLKAQIEYMLQELYEISGLRMFAFVSRNELICDILVKDTPLSVIQNKINQIKILVDEKQIKQALMKCKISSIQGISLNQARFLNPTIKNIGQFLDNLHVVQMITSQQQTQIFLQTCLGIDHRQNLQYIQTRRKQFEHLGLNYDKIVPDSQQYPRIGLLLQRQNIKMEKTMHESRNFDSESVRTEQLFEGKKQKPGNQKPENVVPTKASGKQQYFPKFGKKGKK